MSCSIVPAFCCSLSVAILTGNNGECRSALPKHIPNILQQGFWLLMRCEVAPTLVLALEDDVAQSRQPSVTKNVN